MRPVLSRRTAFTLIELIIVIVVLGLLAGIGILAYTSVVTTSQDRSASLALTDVAREASALAAQNGESEWSEDDWTTALADTAAGPALAGSGVSAAGKLALVNAAADSTNSSSMSYGQVSLQTRAGGVAGLAMKTQAGHCVFVRDVLPQQITTWTAASDLGGNCLASIGLTTGQTGTYTHSDTVVAGATPLAPTGLTATLVSGSVAVNWSAVDGANTYTLYRSTDGGTSWTAVQTGLRFPGTTDATATAGTTYTYAVTATATNESPKSGPASLTLAPAAPTGVTASAVGTTITIAWTAPAGATSFAIYQDGATTASWTGTATRAVWTALNPDGSTHTFAVAASNAAGQGPQSAAASATFMPAAPTGVSATSPAAGQVKVSFTPAPGATGYTVTSSPGGLTAVGTGSGIVVTGLTNGAAYTFTVTANNPAGTSAPSTASNAVTPSSPDLAFTSGNSSCTTGGTGNCYLYMTMSTTGSYTIQAGDKLSYDLFVPTGDSYLAADFTTSDGATLRDSGATDQNGVQAHPQPGAAYAQVPTGAWYHRTIAIPSTLVGKTITYFDLVNERDGYSGTQTAKFDNLVIVNSAGSVTKDYWRPGDATPTLTLHLGAPAGGTVTSSLTQGIDGP